jgi:hypothetical protein
LVQDAGKAAQAGPYNEGGCVKAQPLLFYAHSPHAGMGTYFEIEMPLVARE